MAPKGCWVTTVKVPSSDAIILWSEKTAKFGVSIPQRLSLPLLWSLFEFSSFSVVVNKNVNKLLRLESVTSPMLWITWWNTPGAFSLHFCILQAIKNWRCRRPANKANNHIIGKLQCWRPMKTTKSQILSSLETVTNWSWTFTMEWCGCQQIKWDLQL